MPFSQLALRQGVTSARRPPTFLQSTDMTDTASALSWPIIREDPAMRPPTPWLSGPIVLPLVLALSMLGPNANAQNYSVNVRPDLHDLDIKIEPVANSGMLVVKLTNNTDRKVKCNLRYDAAPQPLYRKTTYVDPGATEESVFRAKRKWFTVDVDVECQASQK
jgi:hypothetical protein